MLGTNLRYAAGWPDRGVSQTKSAHLDFVSLPNTTTSLRLYWLVYPLRLLLLPTTTEN